MGAAGVHGRAAPAVAVRAVSGSRSVWPGTVQVLGRAAQALGRAVQVLGRAVQALGRGVAANVGRIGVVLLGVGFLVWAAVDDDLDTVVTTLLMLCGFAAVVLGLLLPGLAVLRVGTFEVRTRDSNNVGQLAQGVEQIRREKPDPEKVDLPGDDLWDGARYRLGEKTLELLLSNLEGQLKDCEARVFLFDADEQRLMPAYRPESATGEPLGFELGQGVTGRSYQTKRYATAKWQRTHDDTYNLTDEMKERFKGLTAVAAVPLFDREGSVIGTLSLSSTSPATKLTTDLGYNEHLALAEQVAVILIDLLRITA